MSDLQMASTGVAHLTVGKACAADAGRRSSAFEGHANDGGAIPTIQKAETMTPRRRKLASGALGCGVNTHTRRSQCVCYAGLGRNHGVSLQLPTASCRTDSMQLHPEA